MRNGVSALLLLSTAPEWSMRKCGSAVEWSMQKYRSVIMLGRLVYAGESHTVRTIGLRSLASKDHTLKQMRCFWRTGEEGSRCGCPGRAILGRGLWLLLTTQRRWATVQVAAQHWRAIIWLNSHNIKQIAKYRNYFMVNGTPKPHARSYNWDRNFGS